MNTNLAAAPAELAPLAPAAPFTLPLADLAEFSALAERRRVEVQLALRLLARVDALRAQGATLTQAVATVAAAAKHQAVGCSAPTLLRKFYAYAAARDWRALVNHYKGPNTQPAEFIQEVKRVAELNQRSIAEALEQLRERWAAGEVIPGYGTWIDLYLSRHPDRALPKVWPRGFFPDGWSPRNLQRYGPKKGARTLYQRGLAAAKKHFPSVTRDPSQLRPLELIAIDDFELDCYCVFAGDAENKPAVSRVAGLLAIDVGTRRKLHWGMGQRLEREERAPDGTVRTVRTGISRLDVQLFLQSLFSKFGLPDYPITLLVENAAAAISPELALSISTLFDGRVRIERTGLIEHRTLTNGFTERGGKPWEKGWIESAFNSLWNKLGAMKGYKGSIARLNGPANMEAKLAMTKILLGHGERSLNLAPAEIAQLRLPFPNLAECERAFAWACELCDRRTQHRYLGFTVITEYLLEQDGEPQPFEALALMPEGTLHTALPVERMESSQERWDRLVCAVKFTALDPAVLAVFLLTPLRVAYRNSAITFVRNKKGHTYVDQTGAVLADIAEGTEFLGYLDPQNPEHLHITQLNGARTGTLTRLGGKTGLVDVRDKAACAAAGAVVATLVNREISALRERHADEDVALAADKAHNAAIVAAHREASAGLSVAAKIAHASGDLAAKAYERQQRERAVPAQSAGKALADMLPATGTAPTTPAQSTDDATPEAEEGSDAVSFADLR
jgi:hypothetical protein